MVANLCRFTQFVSKNLVCLRTAHLLDMQYAFQAAQQVAPWMRLEVAVPLTGKGSGHGDQHRLVVL